MLLSIASRKTRKNNERRLTGCLGATESAFFLTISGSMPWPTTVCRTRSLCGKHHLTGKWAT
jgi:hypothetical protein